MLPFVFRVVVGADPYRAWCCLKETYSLKVFEDPQETFYKKFLVRGVGQSPAYNNIISYP